MRYLLDTNTCIAILADGWGVLTHGAQATSVDELAVSAITVWELEGGCALSALPAENRRRLDVLLREIHCLPFDRTEALHAGELYAALERAGLRLQTSDCLIAGHALSNKLALVTQDRDFSRVPGLTVVDWLPGGYRRGKK
jgi:tRNA(fMet)-specific endonuclease VapC